MYYSRILRLSAGTIVVSSESSESSESESVCAEVLPARDVAAAARLAQEDAAGEGDARGTERTGRTDLSDGGDLQPARPARPAQQAEHDTPRAAAQVLTLCTPAHLHTHSCTPFSYTSLLLLSFILSSFHPFYFKFAFLISDTLYAHHVFLININFLFSAPLLPDNLIRISFQSLTIHSFQLKFSRLRSLKKFIRYNL